MSKVIGYVRVSTKKQSNDGISIEAQKAKIKAWAELKNYCDEDIEIYVDSGISGKRIGNRPALKEAMNSLQKGDTLVVYSLSRLARNITDALGIYEYAHKNGSDLVLISDGIDTTGAAGKMIFTVVASIAEFEREQIKERISMALDHKRKKGEKLGGKYPPFGYDNQDGLLIKNKTEQEILSLMSQLNEQGYSYQKIADTLNQRKIKTKRGCEWKKHYVFRAMKREGLS
jgi:site-specific DNA recombinase